MSDDLLEQIICLTVVGTSAICLIIYAIKGQL